MTARARQACPLNTPEKLTRKHQKKKVNTPTNPTPAPDSRLSYRGKERARQPGGLGENLPVTGRWFKDRQRKRETFRMKKQTVGQIEKPPLSGSAALGNAIRQRHLILEDLLHVLTPPDNVQLAAGGKKHLASGNYGTSSG